MNDVGFGFVWRRRQRTATWILCFAWWIMMMKLLCEKTSVDGQTILFTIKFSLWPVNPTCQEWCGEPVETYYMRLYGQLLGQGQTSDLMHPKRDCKGCVLLSVYCLRANNLEWKLFDGMIGMKNSSLHTRDSVAISLQRKSVVGLQYNIEWILGKHEK